MQETVRFSFSGGTSALGQLLPMRFKPADLLPEPSPPLLLEQQCNAVQLTAAAREVLHQRTGEPVFVRAAAEALQAAVGSYSPYSHCPAGVAIVTPDGNVYRCVVRVQGVSEMAQAAQGLAVNSLTISARVVRDCALEHGKPGPVQATPSITPAAPITPCPQRRLH